MKKFLIFRICLLALIILAQWTCTTGPEKEEKLGLKFEVSFPSTVHQDPITGRAFVIISKDGQPEPVRRIAPRMFTDVLLWGTDVSELRPEETAVFDQEAFGFPIKA